MSSLNYVCAFLTNAYLTYLTQVLMMTLQNDPPSLESVSEYEDQYKNYGKSIRKLIIDCLQKDPTKRPTASELLKHPFIKKAKDRRYLMQTLLPSTPSFSERSRRALDGKRGSGFDSANNGESGSWVWPPEDGNQRPNIALAEPATSVIYEGSQSSGSASSTSDGVGSSTKSTKSYVTECNTTDEAMNMPCDYSNDNKPKQANDCTQLLK